MTSPSEAKTSDEAIRVAIGIVVSRDEDPTRVAVANELMKYGLLSVIGGLTYVVNYFERLAPSGGLD